MQTPVRRPRLAQSADVEPLIPGLPDDVALHCLLRVSYDHLSLLQSICRRWRHLLRSPDFYARRRLAGITRPLLVLYVRERQGENYRSYTTIFDTVSGTWRLFNPAREPHLHSMIRSPNLIGAGPSMVTIGWCSSPPVRVHDFHTGHCREVAPIPSQDRGFRELGCPVAWNGASRVYIVNRGPYRPANVVHTAMCYDMVEDKWEVLPDAPDGHYPLAVAFYAGAFHIFCRIFGTGELVIDSLDESSGEWTVQEVEKPPMYAIIGKYERPMYVAGEDGDILCRRGRKLSVKYRSEDGWRELLDLPLDVESCEYFTLWKGGVLVTGTVWDSGRRDCHPLNVYTLKLEQDGVTPPSWTAQSLPNAGLVGSFCIKGFWLEI